MAILISLWHRLNKSSMGLSQSFPSKRGGHDQATDWVPFHGAEETLPGSSGPYLAKRPHLESGNEAHASGKKSADGNVSTSSTDTSRKGVHGGVLLMSYGPQPPHHLHLQFFRLVCFSNL